MTTTNTLKGKTAAKGMATGRPVVVHDEDDLDSVLDGDILISAQTCIEFVPAMMRAGAIVTEQGGRFSHAAVWARENNTPAVLQVADATTVLADIAVVTVDATAATITWEASQ